MIAKQERNGLVAEIAGTLLPVLSVCLENFLVAPGSVEAAVGVAIPVKLIPTDAYGKLLLNESVQAKGKVDEKNSAGVRIAFASPSWSLSKIIIGRLSKIAGIEPHAFR
jgi:hypothetical protein